MRRLFESLIPFIFIGIVIVVLVFGLVMFSYLLLFGAIVGLILFIFEWVRTKFKQKSTSPKYHKRSHKGRVIDTDEWKEL